MRYNLILSAIGANDGFHRSFSTVLHVKEVLGSATKRVRVQYGHRGVCGGNWTWWQVGYRKRTSLCLPVFHGQWFVLYFRFVKKATSEQSHKCDFRRAALNVVASHCSSMLQECLPYLPRVRLRRVAQGVLTLGSP